MISKGIQIILLIALVSSCTKDKVESDLERYVSENSNLSTDYLIACAGGSNVEFMGDLETPISIFYYNVDDASSAELFELKEAGLDPSDNANYRKSNLVAESLFNGRMGCFKSPPIFSEKWFIVCYTTATTLHISDPIEILAEEYPTNDISSFITVNENGVTPYFDWTSDPTEGSVIYFSLVSDASENFVSGIYTEVKSWEFYSINEVVLNVTPTENPLLLPNSIYQYLNMGVDEDNWVRSMGIQSFSTN